VADVLLLSFFRASPGILLFRRIAHTALPNPSERTRLVRHAGFMVFKTCLSFLAIGSKASYFKAWDNRLVGACLLFAVSCASVELLLSSFILDGLRRSPLEAEKDGYGLLPDKEGGEARDVEAGEAEKKKAGKPMKASVGRLLSLSKPERGIIIVATVALLLSSLSTMALP
jgi:hypothetical protein